jgi:hypothetical protein
MIEENLSQANAREEHSTCRCVNTAVNDYKRPLQNTNRQAKSDSKPFIEDKEIFGKENKNI